MDFIKLLNWFLELHTVKFHLIFLEYTFKKDDFTSSPTARTEIWGQNTCICRLNRTIPGQAAPLQTPPIKKSKNTLNSTKNLIVRTLLYTPKWKNLSLGCKTSSEEGSDHCWAMLEWSIPRGAKEESRGTVICRAWPACSHTISRRCSASIRRRVRINNDHITNLW